MEAKNPQQKECCGVQVKSITLEMLYSKLQFSTSSIMWVIRKESSACQNRAALQKTKSVFYRGEKSAALLKSTLRSPDEKPGPHSLVTAVPLE